MLDIPPELFKRRDPSRAHDRLEREAPAFRRRVRDGYRLLARRSPRTSLLNADRSESAVAADVASRVGRLLARRRLAPAGALT
ncbi:MAG: hypothetical protein FD126_2676 [Elusimicrobia bacterium]|nr:MAG: hypothetical protein FD126_2676 [Elusimicrobiota bacterium]